MQQKYYKLVQLFKRDRYKYLYKLFTNDFYPFIEFGNRLAPPNFAQLLSFKPL